jgi:hypothetical protein
VSGVGPATLSPQLGEVPSHTCGPWSLGGTRNQVRSRQRQGNAWRSGKERTSAGGAVHAWLPERAPAGPAASWSPKDHGDLCPHPRLWVHGRRPPGPRAVPGPVPRAKRMCQRPPLSSGTHWRHLLVLAFLALKPWCFRARFLQNIRLLSKRLVYRGNTWISSTLSANFLMIETLKSFQLSRMRYQCLSTLLLFSQRFQ